MQSHQRMRVRTAIERRSTEGGGSDSECESRPRQGSDPSGDDLAESSRTPAIGRQHCPASVRSAPMQGRAPVRIAAGLQCSDAGMPAACECDGMRPMAATDPTAALLAWSANPVACAPAAASFSSALARSCQSARVEERRMQQMQQRIHCAAERQPSARRSIRADPCRSVPSACICLSGSVDSPTRPCPAHTCPRFLRFFLRLAVCQHGNGAAAMEWNGGR